MDHSKTTSTTTKKNYYYYLCVNLSNWQTFNIVLKYSLATFCQPKKKSISNNRHRHIFCLIRHYPAIIICVSSSHYTFVAYTRSHTNTRSIEFIQSNFSHFSVSRLCGAHCVMIYFTFTHSLVHPQKNTNNKCSVLPLLIIEESSVLHRV